MSGLEPLALLTLVAGGASTAISAVGSIASGNAAAALGSAQQQLANYQAKQLEIRAQEEMALGQRAMKDERRKKELTLSTLQARAGSQGFSATDPTALALADEISKYGTLKEQTALYGGEAKAQNLKTAAAATRYSGQLAAWEGDVKQDASYLTAAGTILGGVSGMAKYAGTLPSFSSALPTPGSLDYAAYYKTA